MWHLFKKGTKSTEHPASEFDGKSASGETVPTKSEEAFPAKPQSPPIAPIETEIETEEMRAAKFSAIGVKYGEVRKAEISGLPKVIPDELKKDTEKMNQYFHGCIDLVIDATQLLRAKIALNENSALQSTIKAVLWQEATERQKAKIEADGNSYSFYEKNQLLRNGSQEIFNELYKKVKEKMDWQKAINRYRLENNLKPDDIVDDDKVRKMMQLIQDRKTPIPRKADNATEKSAKNESSPSS